MEVGMSRERRASQWRPKARIQVFFSSDPQPPPQDSGTRSCYVALDGFKLMAILLP